MKGMKEHAQRAMSPKPDPVFTIGRGPRPRMTHVIHTYSIHKFLDRAVHKTDPPQTHLDAIPSEISTAITFKILYIKLKSQHISLSTLCPQRKA